MKWFKLFLFPEKSGFCSSLSSQVGRAALRMLRQIPDSSKVIIDASESINIDHDVLEIISEFETNAKYRGIELEIIDRKIKSLFKIRFENLL